MKRELPKGHLSMALIFVVSLFYLACEQNESENDIDNGPELDVQAPSIPENLAPSQINDSSIAISWKAAKDNVKVSQYMLYQDSVEVYRDTLTNYLAKNLVPETRYKYSVRAKDDAGNVSAYSKEIEIITKASIKDSVIVDEVLPSAPINLLADNILQTSVDLIWEAPTDSAGITGYKVYQDTVLITSVAETSYQVTGLVPDSAYIFAVSAMDSLQNESVISNALTVMTLIEEMAQQDTIAPSAPKNLTASKITETTIDLNWNSATDGVGVTGYAVYQDTTLLAKVIDTTFQVIDRTPSGEYSFYVSAWDAAENESKYSNVLVVQTESEDTVQRDTTAPLAPKEITANDITKSTVRLTWQPAVDSASVIEYLVYQNTVPIGNVLEAEFLVSDMTPATEYIFTVSAVDIEGNESTESEPLVLTTEEENVEEEDIAGSAAPTNLNATSITQMTVDLRWDDADGVNISGYRVYRNEENIATVELTTYQATGLLPTTEYSFTVSSVDSIGIESPQSAPLIVATEKEETEQFDSEPPTTPQDLTVREVTQTSANLSWTISTDSVGVVGYRVYQNDEVVATVTEATYTADGLAPDTAYSVTISAFDAAENESVQSESVTFTITKIETPEEEEQSPNPDLTPPTIPSSLSISNITMADADLGWAPSFDEESGIVGYRVYLNGKTIADVADVSYTVTNLDAGSTYSIHVSAIDAAGNESNQSDALIFYTEEEVVIENERVLVFTKTVEFRHKSIGKGVATFVDLGATNEFEVVQTENSTDFNAQNLQQYQLVIFLNTTGDVLDQTQQTAFENYIRSGGSYMGVHAATDTEFEWSWYGQLVGAYFNGHPDVQQATVNLVEQNHPSTSHLPNAWQRTDEWYNFRNINPRIIPLLNVDENTYAGGTNGADHPIAWYHEFDGGRSFYTGGGHSDSAYDEPDFRQHLLGGIEYCLGR